MPEKVNLRKEEDSGEEPLEDLSRRYLLVLFISLEAVNDGIADIEEDLDEGHSAEVSIPSLSEVVVEGLPAAFLDCSLHLFGFKKQL